MSSTIFELLRTQAEHASEGVAIRALGRSALTYGGLLSQVESVVKALNVRGVQRSDRIAIVAPNGPEMAVAFLGVAASAVCAPLNPAYSADEFEFYFSDLNPKALIIPSGMNSAAITVAKKRGIPIIELIPTPEAAAGIFTLRSNEQPLGFHGGFPLTDDIALILHTSGTTSRPKMVPLTHANLLPQPATLPPPYSSAKRIAASTSCHCFTFMGWLARCFRHCWRGLVWFVHRASMLSSFSHGLRRLVRPGIRRFRRFITLYSRAGKRSRVGSRIIRSDSSGLRLPHYLNGLCRDWKNCSRFL